jgi:hypothetical protein
MYLNETPDGRFLKDSPMTPTLFWLYTVQGLPFGFQVCGT